MVRTISDDERNRVNFNEVLLLHWYCHYSNDYCDCIHVYTDYHLYCNYCLNTQYFVHAVCSQHLCIRSTVYTLVLCIHSTVGTQYCTA